MGRQRYIRVEIVTRREGKYFVSDCPKLGTSSFGSTEEESRRSLVDATVLYLNTLEELGECQRVLRERGIEVHQYHDAQPTICPPSDTYAVSFPLGNMASA